MPFDTLRHSNVQSKPEYRRIERYCKGLKKYQAEKLRRRQILTLQSRGLSSREIATQLGVSASTVKRDLHKLERYAKGRLNASSQAGWAAFGREFSAWPEEEQFAYLARMRKIHRIRKCKALVITLNVDAALRGRRPVAFKPNLPVQILDNTKITFEIAVAGRRQILGRVYVQEVADGGLSLQTNDSIKAQIKDVLSGLRIVDSPAGNVEVDFSV